MKRILKFFGTLIVSYCIQGCFIFTKENYQTSDKPLVIETDYTIKQEPGTTVSRDSTFLSVIVYDKSTGAPMPYMVIEIVGFKKGLTKSDGHFDILIPSGSYNIKVHNEEMFEIKNIILQSGTKNIVEFNLGTFIWR